VHTHTHWACPACSGGARVGCIAPHPVPRFPDTHVCVALWRTQLLPALRGWVECAVCLCSNGGASALLQAYRQVCGHSCFPAARVLCLQNCCVYWLAGRHPREHPLRRPALPGSSCVCCHPSIAAAAAASTRGRSRPGQVESVWSQQDLAGPAAPAAPMSVGARLLRGLFVIDTLHSCRCIVFARE
jgi:hypothetical protein